MFSVFFPQYETPVGLGFIVEQLLSSKQIAKLIGVYVILCLAKTAFMERIATSVVISYRDFYGLQGAVGSSLGSLTP